MVATRIKSFFGPFLIYFMIFACNPVEARTERFYGYAFDATTGQYLYTETHTQNYDAERWLGGVIRYFDSQGKPIGEKTLDFSRDPYIPLTRFRLIDQHYEDGVTAVTADTVTMQTLVAGKRATAQVARVSAMAADAGFNSFVVANLDSLLAGETVPLTFAVVGQLTTYRFRVTKVAAGESGGKKTVRLRVEPNSLLSLIVTPLFLTYDIEPRNWSNLSVHPTSSARKPENHTAPA